MYLMARDLPKDRRECFFDMVRCSWIDCVCGIALSGRGCCPGMWWHASCPEWQDKLSWPEHGFLDVEAGGRERMRQCAV